jgi:replicative superfamily II helicase/very-short-patch-repair endonuclease
MSLHPIVALNHVIDEYRDYLLTEFRAKDRTLKESLESALDEPLFLAQEPFFQTHRPFKSGKKWTELSIDAKLAHVMESRSRQEHAYLHQSLAIERLLEPDAGPIVVTTGTGSGKTEAFLLPAIQNAIEDATRFRRPGLTAILLYPMNALANDQSIRIGEYLRSAGFDESVKVAQYDRGTGQTEREALRRNPPHILLTNYMMLEYLLVRPADRDGIFANHRCRFLVLDEVHTYRGTLGSNIAFLVRRLRTHLARARHDWNPDPPEVDRAKRFPKLIPVGTSATIKSLSEQGLTREERIRLRDEAVQEFFGKLTGVEPAAIRVIGEELEQIHVPEEAVYPAQPIRVQATNLDDAEAVRQALCSLGGQPTTLSIEDAAKRCELLWDLNRWLIAAPMSTAQIVRRVQTEVPERRDANEADLRHEIEAALMLGAALPDAVPGALRLRVHRFIRGGWRFHRCIEPTCGRLYPMGEERCECGAFTAPLYLCRNCGADYLRLVGNPDQPLRPSAIPSEDTEWMLYEPRRFDLQIQDDEDTDDQEQQPRPGAFRAPAQMRGRPVLRGSFDPTTLAFSRDAADYPMSVALAPARTRCLCCGGSAGSRNVITPVALGTSAAVKVLAEGLVEALDEANHGRDGHDGKERLLVFSDSRQDAAHQARFIIFASRYDRMRRNLMHLLNEQGPLSIQRAVELLGLTGATDRDNPHVGEGDPEYFPTEVQQRMRAWEEAPLLDDLAVNAGYRATLVNLGLLEVRYDQLDKYVRDRGAELANSLGINQDQLRHVCRCILDEMRRLGALSREMLRYHPSYPACPSYIRSAEWERRVRAPKGFAADDRGRPAPNLDAAIVPPGITLHNAWKRPGVGGRSPSLERIFRSLIARFGGAQPDADSLVEALRFLQQASFVVASELYGFRGHTRLLQVNAERVVLALADPACRTHCNVCGTALAGAQRNMPCPRCHGSLVPWTEEEVEDSRTVRRVRAEAIIPLVAKEHTAQIPNDERATIEEMFKAPGNESKVNLLACSPTLEMGIDVGGLEAVVLRNVPPRPDNYAQRGGRAGRRLRIGMVVGYARSTPHDQYFYDHPEEMISGEVPAPVLSLANRDVLLRHVNAIVFGASQPGLAGRMAEYISPRGEVQQATVDALIQGVSAKIDYAVVTAREAFGDDVLAMAQLHEQTLREQLGRLPERVQDVVNRTARQVAELRQALDAFAAELIGASAGNRAADLVARLLGLPTDRSRNRAEADDRSAGYPLRRFAEFGILPGYEFPSEPASLRLLGDSREEDPITVTRRFGIAQFQPGAQVYARTKRWRVIGLDTASPWNPQTQGPSWMYRLCRECGLRYGADHPQCPRCRADAPGRPIPATEYAGFIARREENIILDEEDRYATPNRVKVYPQWDGEIVARWSIGPAWGLRLTQREEIQWINEGDAPSGNELDAGLTVLHTEAKGYLLCSSCGRILIMPAPVQNDNGGRRRAQNRRHQDDPFGHSEMCAQRGTPPTPMAIATANRGEVLRLIVPVPVADDDSEFKSWGLSLGYALQLGMRHAFMLDDSEIDFELEGPWPAGDPNLKLMSLSFVDPTLGGTGYLRRIADEFHLVAQRSIEQLDHSGCETACYRCLKAYDNQRHHEYLRWPAAMDTLETLAGNPPVRRPAETGDIDNPRPWLEAYSAGVGSPLEYQFLRLFQQHGFDPQRQVPIPVNAPISIADFAVPEARLAIYIDGAAFHVGANLRRDRRIRDSLRQGASGWIVEELRAADLAQGAKLVERLKALGQERSATLQQSAGL